MRLLVTGIERDGAMQGPDLDLLAEVSALSGMAVIASGGVGNLSDLETVAALGCEAVIVGRALYEGPIHAVPGNRARPASSPIADGGLRTATPPPPSRH